MVCCPINYGLNFIHVATAYGKASSNGPIPYLYKGLLALHCFVNKHAKVIFVKNAFHNVIVGLLCHQL